MFFYKLSGYRMSADEAYLIIRGLRTLDTRLKQHAENTKMIINFLKKQKKLKKFYTHIIQLVKIINFGKNIILEQRGYYQSLLKVKINLQ